MQATDSGPALPAAAAELPTAPASAEALLVPLADDGRPNGIAQEETRKDARPAAAVPEPAASRQSADSLAALAAIPGTQPTADLRSTPGNESLLLGAQRSVSTLSSWEGQIAAQPQAAAPEAADSAAQQLGDLLGSLAGWPVDSSEAAAPANSSGNRQEEEQLSDIESETRGSEGPGGRAAASWPPAVAGGPDAATLGAAQMPAPQPSLDGLSDVSTETDAGSDEGLEDGLAGPASGGSAAGAAAGLQARPGEQTLRAVQQPAQTLVSEAAQGLQQKPLHLHPGGASAGRRGQPGSPRVDSLQPEGRAQQQEQGMLHLDLLPPVTEPAAAGEQPDTPAEVEHQNDAPGVQQGQQESLLQAAERLEARLAAGSSAADGPDDTRGPAGLTNGAAGQAEDAAYKADLLLASIISQVGQVQSSGSERRRAGHGLAGRHWARRRSPGKFAAVVPRRRLY